MKKVWNKILNDYNDLEIIELDYDIDSNKVAEYNPGKVLPIVIFLDKNGLEIERLIGEQKESVIRNKIEEYKNK